MKKDNRTEKKITNMEDLLKDPALRNAALNMKEALKTNTEERTTVANNLDLDMSTEFWHSKPEKEPKQLSKNEQKLNEMNSICEEYIDILNKMGELNTNKDIKLILDNRINAMKQIQQTLIKRSNLLNVMVNKLKSMGKSIMDIYKIFKESVNRAAPGIPPALVATAAVVSGGVAVASAGVAIVSGAVAVAAGVAAIVGGKTAVVGGSITLALKLKSLGIPGKIKKAVESLNKIKLQKNKGQGMSI